MRGRYGGGVIAGSQGLNRVIQSNPRPRCRLFHRQRTFTIGLIAEMRQTTSQRKATIPLQHPEIVIDRDRQQYTNREKWQRFRPISRCRSRRLAALLVALRFSSRCGECKVVGIASHPASQPDGIRFCEHIDA